MFDNVLHQLCCLSVAVFLRRAGGSMLESTGSHGRGVEQRVPEMRRMVEFNWPIMGHNTHTTRSRIPGMCFPRYLHVATYEMWCWSGGSRILRKLSLCYSIVYCYNGAQRYEQFLQVGWLYRVLILLVLALSSECLCVFGLYDAMYIGLLNVFAYILLFTF